MDFSFSEEQQMVAQTVRDLLTDQCSSGDLRKMMTAGEGLDEARWTRLCEMGLPGIMAPEEAGGLALKDEDFVLVAEECGRAALPEPLVEHAGIAVPMLAALIDNPSVRKVLEAAATGEGRVAVGHPANLFVDAADSATTLLLWHNDEVHLVPVSDVDLVRQPSIDSFRRLFRVEWTPSANTKIADATKGKALWALALDRGALYAAAQCLGMAQRVVEIAVAYTKDRTQFGKAIGSYQAIKHHLANCQVKIEYARPAVYAAAATVETPGPEVRALVSNAKLSTVEAADFAARTGVQVHGAMGYSWEVDVHFFLKRALGLAGAWGDRNMHLARVADCVLNSGMPLGPAATFPGGTAHAR